MPNWCATSLEFQDTKENCKILHDKIKEWTSKNYMKNGFGTEWLGNICLGSGIMTEEEMNKGLGYECRGWMSYINLEENKLFVDVETAWSPMLEMWVAIIEKLGMKDMKILYTADEPGNGLYCTNDPKMKKIHILEAYFTRANREVAGFFGLPVEEYISEYDFTQEWLEETLEKAKKVYPKVNDIEKIPLRGWKSFICLHKYDFVDIDEF